ncbi:hypothetical protein [Terrimonas alba]|uniref:hypothetical protein n=1 Tax=Terrimonas alba TaxID=3349636 RepID=UPI0035F4F04F
MNNRFGTTTLQQTIISTLLFVATPFIIYFFFLEWKTNTPYGDDLFMFRTHAEIDTITGKLNLPLLFGKYRPMHGLSVHLLIESFGKNLNGYYLFNVFIQAVNTILFAITVNIFLRKFYISFFFSLVAGLSMFSFFNITQLLNGGALEGLAMSFFLAALFFSVKAIHRSQTNSRIQRNLIAAYVFSNLSMYTHERYVILFPFIILLILIHPALRALRTKQKVFLIGAGVFSILLNVMIKKYVYAMPFLMGTASKTIEFSFSSAMSFLGDAVLSIFFINSGPEYLIGIRFPALPLLNKVIVILLLTGFMTLLGYYIAALFRKNQRDKKARTADFYTFLSLAVLFGLALLPAIITIRLEQRWLQASFCIFMLMCVLAADRLIVKKVYFKYVYLFLISIFVVTTHYSYLKKGADNIYLVYSEKTAGAFKNAATANIIRPSTEKLYIWEKKNDENANNAMRWSLGDGYLLSFYQEKPKQVIFVDSLYEKSHWLPDTTLRNFNAKIDQIVYLIYGETWHVVDITRDYLNDTLKYFTTVGLNEAAIRKRIDYNQSYVKITNADTAKFLIDGLYQNENGASWTNGNVSFGFRGDFVIDDSVTLLLETYLPPPCKNIIPRLSVLDFGNNEYPAALIRREADKFTYRLDVKRASLVQKIRIVSDVIQATPPDQRILSFPFISLEIRN